MKTSTRLDLMVVVWVALAAAGAGCGDDGGDDDNGTSADAGPPTGDWKLTSVSGVTVPVNGTLLLDAPSGVGAYASIQVKDGRTDFDSLTALAGTFMLDVAKGTLELGGDSFTMVFPGTGTKETMALTTPGGVTYTYERLVGEPVDTISLSGRASIEAGAPTLDTPRVALIAMLRGSGGVGVRFFAVPTSEEPMIDVALPAGFGDAAGDTADFTLARTQGALGVERIAFGTTGFAAVNLIVAYEDRDHDGKLGRFDLDDCADPAVDCIRGLSPVVLAARDGDSPELEAAGYGLMRTGWVLSAVVEDRRTDGVTIVPLDPTGPAVPIDVKFAANASAVEYPNLVF